MISATILAGAMILSQINRLDFQWFDGCRIRGFRRSVMLFWLPIVLRKLFSISLPGELWQVLLSLGSVLCSIRKRNKVLGNLPPISRIWLTIILLLISIACFIFAPQIVRYFLVRVFSLNDPHLQDLTVSLLRISITLSNHFRLERIGDGILNTHHHFLVPGLAPAM